MEPAKDRLTTRYCGYRLAVEIYEKSLVRADRPATWYLASAILEELAGPTITSTASCIPSITSATTMMTSTTTTTSSTTMAISTSPSMPLRRKIEFSFACPFCEGTLFEPVTTSCGHTFCRNCMETGKNCRVCGQKILTVGQTNVLVQRLVEKWWPREAEASKARHEGDLLIKEGDLAQALDRYNLAVRLGEKNTSIVRYEQPA
ncbi:LON peptidase N-terminal domain and RING finger protein 1 [Vespula maculifrons]|uniref:LON peptidase N-terminal domain and RING finger protein 1 n=1 Tax=Vespula maculifrons TaxID=7453 RepID=A0ABD2CDL3_VESMC